MFRLRMVVAVVGVTAATVGTTVAAGGVAVASGRPADVVLAGSAVPFASHARPTGSVAGSTRLTIEVWLKPDLAGAARFASAVSTPGSTLFRHYLSPAAYTARFGASRAAATKVESWLRTEGFTAVTTDTGRSYVRATAPVSKINAAFRVQLRTYRSSASAHADGIALHANDRAVSLPASLAGRVLAVTGLDNAAPILPLAKGATTVARRAARPAARDPGGRALFELLRAAHRRRPAPAVRRRLVPDLRVRVQRRADAVGLPGQLRRHRPGADHRPG